PARRALRARRRDVHGKRGLAAFAEGLEPVQRSRGAPRLEVDDARVHGRERHGADRRPLRRSIPLAHVASGTLAAWSRSTSGITRRSPRSASILVHTATTPAAPATS